MPQDDDQEWPPDYGVQVSHQAKHHLVTVTSSLCGKLRDCIQSCSHSHVALQRSTRSYLAEDSNASLGSHLVQDDMQRSHSNFSVVSRAISVVSRTHSTFLAKHKKFGLKRKSLWAKVGILSSQSALTDTLTCTKFQQQAVSNMHTPVARIQTCFDKH